MHGQLVASVSSTRPLSILYWSHWPLASCLCSSSDCHLPRHGGIDVEYDTTEGEWFEKFSGEYRRPGTQGRTFIRTSYQALLPRTEFWYCPIRTLDGGKHFHRSLRLPAEEAKLLVIFGSSEIHKLRLHETTWSAKIPSPKTTFACEGFSKAVIAQIRHNNPCGRQDAISSKILLGSIATSVIF